ncbi:flagellar basal body P-ring protein FlgI [Thermaurantiacus tibetensis]|uniref:flagellar basal body P-ring protein FlgI n=1 Tax=Thermaurantiacus tibetensis TaxID=2759035 RepID=UPI00188F2076|nr:flagellar basal body P-ring protein FlgI [Thermaurantiacus tibetensis]
MRALVFLAALILALPALAERVKDVARFQGVRGNALVGYGLVVGLPGTGDDNLVFTLQSMRSAAAALGVRVPPNANAQLKNSAAVMLTAELPPFAKPGQRIDVSVAALGRAKSLRGGTLLLAELKGPDGETYALAQGPLTVGGFGAEGADGSRIVVNTPTSGRIPGGAIVERAVPLPFAGPGPAGGPAPLVLDLLSPSFSLAQAIAEAINAAEGAPVAEALDAVSVAVRAPADPAARVRLAARIEALEVSGSAPPARVVVNARTGTVVIGGNVRLLPAAVAHGNLTVRVTETLNVSQPAPFARGGRTVVTPQSDVAAEEEQVRMAVLAPGPRLQDLVDAINALGAAPGDLVAILEALREAGALRAELVVI